MAKAGRVDLEFRSNWWKEGKSKIMDARRKRAEIMADRNGPVGQPIAEIIRVMAEDPLRFKLERTAYGSMMSEYSIRDNVAGFFFKVGMVVHSYRSPDDFEEYVTYARRSQTTNLDWATNFEIQAIGLAAEKLRGDQYKIELGLKAAEKAAELKHGRGRVMTLYGLEEK